MQREEQQAELAKQQVGLDAALQRQKIASQREKAQALEQEKIHQHEERQLRIKRGVPVEDPIRVGGFRLPSSVKFVPRFQDSDRHLYLVAFEKCMFVHNFPTDVWTLLIHTQLTRKALKILAEFSVDTCMDFDVLKQACLLAYEREPQFHRKSFRTINKANG